VIIFSINLQILIVLWWGGAILSGVSLLIPQYKYYLIFSSLGWITLGLTSGFIIYAVKRNNKESQKNMSSKIN